MQTQTSVDDERPVPTADEAPVAPAIRLERYVDAERRTGLCRQRINTLVKDGKFPAPVRLHAHLVGFFSHEIDAWLLSRPRATASAPEKGNAPTATLRDAEERRKRRAVERRRTRAKSMRARNTASASRGGP